MPEILARMELFESVGNSTGELIRDFYFSKAANSAPVKLACIVHK